MSISEPLTPKQIESAFEKILADKKFTGMPSDCGFDSQTEAALMSAKLNPDDPRAAAKARKVLQDQLSGKHAYEDEQDWARAIAEAKKRRR